MAKSYMENTGITNTQNNENQNNNKIKLHNTENGI